MTPTSTTPVPTSPPNPNLAPLYTPYLSAFNSHSWPLIHPHLSPTCHCTFRGTLVSTSAESMKPDYEKDFERCERHDVVVKEMEQIERVFKEGEEEWKGGIRWGLRVVLYDNVMRRTLWVNYWYREEAGKWMQAWHEILESVADGNEGV